MDSIHVFIKNCEIQTVLNEVFAILNQNPAEIRINDYGVVGFYACDIEFAIDSNHELEDDCGIKFSEYPISIGLIKLRRGEDCLSYNDLVLVLGKYLAEKLAKKFNCQTMLTINLVKIIDEYSGLPKPL